MTTIAQCERCGTTVEAGSLFCKRCGADVSGQQGEAATKEMKKVDRSATSVMQAGLLHSLRDATLGEYEILAELGRGGMATVFLAHDIALDRKVAIKVMAPHLLEGEGMVERFKLEARTSAQLAHPHIIPIYAVKQTESTLYFVMKFIEGRALDSMIKTMGPLPIPMVKDILTKVGQALGYAHRRGVVHRDIKPGNIMIDEEGTPIVTDFGIAKVAQARGLTMTGATIGTPSYMSPEQCAALEVTGASDQYSLGILAYEMLTGKLPFDAETIVSIMYKHCHEAAPPLENLRPDCPPELKQTIERMLLKDPAERWPTLEAAVQNLGSGSTLAFDDPVRTQMIEMAKQGSHREVLARVSTPRSPMPKLDNQATVRVRESELTGKKTKLAPQPKPKRTGLMVAVIAVLIILGGGAAAMVLKPWESQAAAAPQVATVPEPGPQTPLPAPQVEAPVAAQPQPEATQPAPSPSPAAPLPVGSVTLSPNASQLAPGESIALSALVRDTRNQPVGDRSVAWASSNPGVARVAGGRVTAVAPGNATITATSEGRSASAAITVAAVVEAVASVVVQAPSQPLNLGQTARLTAEARSSAGAPLGRPITWESSNPSVASVSANGEVRAMRPGTATITATSENVSGRATLTIREDVRAAITDVVDSYARALESRDIAQVRRVHHGLTSEQERQLRSALDVMRDLKANLRITSLEEAGDRATADVSGTYTFYNASTRREEQAPVTFRAIFERGPDGWRLTQTR